MHLKIKPLDFPIWEKFFLGNTGKSSGSEVQMKGIANENFRSVVRGSPVVSWLQNAPFSHRNISVLAFQKCWLFFVMGGLFVWYVGLWAKVW